MYCIVVALTGEERPEHPIPASLGASLTVSTVCDGCNGWAGREIDQPFLADHLLLAHRGIANQRDPRRGKKARRATSPVLRGHTEDGDYVAYDYEMGRPVMGSRIVDLGGGRFQIRAGSQHETDRLMEKIRMRAAAEGKETKIEQVERGAAKPEIKANVMTRPGVWRREAAKIGLAVGSVVYSPAWRLSQDASLLREWMHRRDTSTPDGKAPALVPTHSPADVSLAQEDEHMLYFMRLGDDTTYLVVTLFGRSCFAVPVDTTGAPVPTQAWRLDWRYPKKDGSTTWDDLLRDAVVRRAKAQAA